MTNRALFTLISTWFLSATLTFGSQCGCGKSHLTFSAGADVTEGGNCEIKVLGKGEPSPNAPVDLADPVYKRNLVHESTASYTVEIEKNVEYDVQIQFNGGVGYIVNCMVPFVDANFQVDNSCGYEFEIMVPTSFVGGDGQWVKTSAIRANKTPTSVTEPHWEGTFKIRLAKKRDATGQDGSSAADSDSQSCSESSSSGEPSVADDSLSDGSASSSSSSSTPEVTPAGVNSSVNIQSNNSGTITNEGSLSLAGTIAPSLVSVANLKANILSDASAGISVVNDMGVIRQVKTPGYLRDINNVLGGGFSINLYVAGQYAISPTSAGFYTVNSGAVPVNSITYTPVAASGDHFGGIKITKTDTTGVTSEKQYLALSSGGESYRVIEGGNQVTEVMSTFTKSSGYWLKTTQTNVSRDGQPYSKNIKIYRYLVALDSISGIESSYEFLLSSEDFAIIRAPEATQMEGDSLTTTYEPHPDFPGKVKSVSYPDGSWVVYDYYLGNDITTGSSSGMLNLDARGRGLLKSELRPWNGGPATPALASTENSKLITHTYYPRSSNSDLEYVSKDVTEQAPGGLVIGLRERSTMPLAPSAVFDILTGAGLNTAWAAKGYFQDDSISQGGLLIQSELTYDTANYESSAWNGRSLMSLSPEGDGELVGYELGSFSGTTFTVDAPSSSSNSTHIRSIALAIRDFQLPVANEATKTVTISERTGRILRKELWILNGASSTWNLATVTTYEYPSFWPDGSVKETTVKQDGRIISQTQRVSSVETLVTDEQGIQVSTVVDSLGRTATETRHGAAAGSNYAAQADQVTSYTYSGRSQTQVLTAGSLSQTSSTSMDCLGRTISETDVRGAITSTSYPNGGRDTTVTRLGSTIQSTVRSIDGRVSLMAGTTVVGRAYTYEYTESGNLVTTTYLGGTISSPRYESVETDLAGRTVSVIKPSATGTGTVTVTYDYVMTYAPNEEHPESSIWIRSNSITSPSGNGAQVTQINSHPTKGSSIEYTGYDEDGGGLTAASTDRLTETRSYYVNEGGYWWQVSSRKRYDAANSAATAVTDLQKTCLYGNPDGNASLRVTVASSGETVTTVKSYNRTAKVLTSSSTSSRSTIPAVTTNVNGLLVASNGTDNATSARWTHDALGRPIKQVSSRGAISFTAYNADGSVASRTDAYGKTTSYTYYTSANPASGKVSVVTDANGKTTTYAYDSLGNTTEVAGTSTYKVTYEYDAYGAMSKMFTWRTSGASDQTQWTHEPGTGLLASKTDAASKSVSYTYYANGQLATRTWARGTTTTYSYTDDGDLSLMDYSDTTPDVTLSGYDRLGRPTSVSQDGIGAETYVYFPGRLERSARYFATGHSFLPGLGIRYGTPDSTGRSTGFMETSSSNATVVRTVGYAYDTAGRLSAITDGSQSTIYSYQADSSLIGEIQSQASGTSWFREGRGNDAAGRLIGIRSHRMSGGTVVAGISSFSYDYDAVGRRTKSTLQDGSSWNYGYNDHSEVSTVARKNASGVTNNYMGSGYFYDGIGNRSYTTSSVLGTRVYSTNSLDQYASVIQSSALGIIGRADPSWTINIGRTGETTGSSVTRIEDFYYAVINNSTTANAVYQSVTIKRSTGTPSYTRMMFFPKATTALSYDFDGNLTNDGRWVYTWDAENRLIQMETSIDVTKAEVGMPYMQVKFAYDWEGHRIAKTVFTGSSSTQLFSSTRRWIYDGWNPIVEFSATAETGGTLTRLNTFTWGLDLADQKGIPAQKAGGVGGLLYQTTVATGVIERASYDGNGNVISWTKSTATNPTYRCEYDAFGNTVVAEGSAPSSYGFSTKMQDALTGLYYYGYRYYNAVDGRWINRDPIAEKGGVNLYLFCRNRAVNSIDNLGAIEFQTIKFFDNDIVDGGLAPDLVMNGSFKWACSDGVPLFGDLEFKVELEHSFIENVSFVIGFGANGKASSKELPVRCGTGQNGSAKKVVITWHANVVHKIGFGIGWFSADFEGNVLAGVGNRGYEINCCCNKSSIRQLSSKENWEVIDEWKH